MIRLFKHPLFKTAALTVAAIFTINSAVYGIDLSSNSPKKKLVSHTLRKPLDFSDGEVAGKRLMASNLAIAIAASIHSLVTATPLQSLAGDTTTRHIVRMPDPVVLRAQIYTLLEKKLGHAALQTFRDAGFNWEVAPNGDVWVYHLDSETFITVGRYGDIKQKVSSDFYASGLTPQDASNQKNSSQFSVPRAQKKLPSNQFENIDLSLRGDKAVSEPDAAILSNRKVENPLDALHSSLDTDLIASNTLIPQYTYAPETDETKQALTKKRELLNKKYGTWTHEAAVAKAMSVFAGLIDILWGIDRSGTVSGDYFVPWIRYNENLLLFTEIVRRLGNDSVHDKMKTALCFYFLDEDLTGTERHLKPDLLKKARKRWEDWEQNIKQDPNKTLFDAIEQMDAFVLVICLARQTGAKVEESVEALLGDGKRREDSTMIDVARALIGLSPEDAAHMARKLTDLNRQWYEITQWDLANRFPGQEGMVLFHGAHNQDESVFFLNPGASLYASTFFVDIPTYAEASVEARHNGAIIAARVPFKYMHYVGWLPPEGFPPEPEMAIAPCSLRELGGLTIYWLSSLADMEAYRKFKAHYLKARQAVYAKGFPDRHLTLLGEKIAQDGEIERDSCVPTTPGEKKWLKECAAQHETIKPQLRITHVKGELPIVLRPGETLEQAKARIAKQKANKKISSNQANEGENIATNDVLHKFSSKALLEIISGWVDDTTETCLAGVARFIARVQWGWKYFREPLVLTSREDFDPFLHMMKDEFPPLPDISYNMYIHASSHPLEFYHERLRKFAHIFNTYYGISLDEARQHGLTAYIEQRLNNGQEVDLLEIGCGLARALWQLDAKFGDKVHLTGLDRHPWWKPGTIPLDPASGWMWNMLFFNKLDPDIDWYLKTYVERTQPGGPAFIQQDAVKGLPDVKRDIIISINAFMVDKNSMVEKWIHNAAGALKPEGIVLVDEFSKYMGGEIKGFLEVLVKPRLWKTEFFSSLPYIGRYMLINRAFKQLRNTGKYEAGFVGKGFYIYRKSLTTDNAQIARTSIASNQNDNGVKQGRIPEDVIPPKPRSSTIVIAEDKIDAAQQLARWFPEEEGYIVVILSTAEDVLDYVNKRQVDIIIADSVLTNNVPGMEDIVQAQPHIKIISWSGDPQKVEELKSVAPEEVPYLITGIDKATSPETIKNEVDKVLAAGPPIQWLSAGGLKKALHNKQRIVPTISLSDSTSRVWFSVDEVPYSVSRQTLGALVDILFDVWSDMMNEPENIQVLHPHPNMPLWLKELLNKKGYDRAGLQERLWFLQDAEPGKAVEYFTQIINQHHSAAPLVLPYAENARPLLKVSDTRDIMVSSAMVGRFSALFMIVLDEDKNGYVDFYKLEKTRQYEALYSFLTAMDTDLPKTKLDLGEIYHGMETHIRDVRFCNVVNILMPHAVSKGISHEALLAWLIDGNTGDDALLCKAQTRINGWNAPAVKASWLRPATSKNIAAAGSFDVLHFGHHALFEPAFKKGDHLIIYLLSDKGMGKQKSYIPRRYAARRRNLVKFLDIAVMGRNITYEIRQFDEHDEFVNFLLADPDIDVLLTNEEYMEADKKYNLQRQKYHNEPLTLCEIPLVRYVGTDVKVSSTDFRNTFEHIWTLLCDGQANQAITYVNEHDIPISAEGFMRAIREAYVYVFNYTQVRVHTEKGGNSRILYPYDERTPDGQTLFGYRVTHPAVPFDMIHMEKYYFSNNEWTPPGGKYYEEINTEQDIAWWYDAVQSKLSCAAGEVLIPSIAIDSGQAVHYKGLFPEEDILSSKMLLQKRHTPLHEYLYDHPRNITAVMKGYDDLCRRCVEANVAIPPLNDCGIDAEEKIWAIYPLKLRTSVKHPDWQGYRIVDEKNRKFFKDMKLWKHGAYNSIYSKYPAWENARSDQPLPRFVSPIICDLPLLKQQVFDALIIQALNENPASSPTIQRVYQEIVGEKQIASNENQAPTTEHSVQENQNSLLKTDLVASNADLRHMSVAHIAPGQSEAVLNGKTYHVLRVTNRSGLPPFLVAAHVLGALPSERINYLLLEAIEAQHDRLPHDGLPVVISGLLVDSGRLHSLYDEVVADERKYIEIFVQAQLEGQICENVFEDNSLDKQDVFVEMVRRCIEICREKHMKMADMSRFLNAHDLNADDFITSACLEILSIIEEVREGEKIAFETDEYCVGLNTMAAYADQEILHKAFTELPPSEKIRVAYHFWRLSLEGETLPLIEKVFNLPDMFDDPNVRPFIDIPYLKSLGLTDDELMARGYFSGYTLVEPPWHEGYAQIFMFEQDGEQFCIRFCPDTYHIERVMVPEKLLPYAPMIRLLSRNDNIYVREGLRQLDYVDDPDVVSAILTHVLANKQLTPSIETLRGGHPKLWLSSSVNESSLEESPKGVIGEQVFFGNDDQKIVHFSGAGLTTPRRGTGMLLVLLRRWAFAQPYFREHFPAWQIKVGTASAATVKNWYWDRVDNLHVMGGKGLTEKIIALARVVNGETYTITARFASWSNKIASNRALRRTALTKPLREEFADADQKSDGPGTVQESASLASNEREVVQDRMTVFKEVLALNISGNDKKVMKVKVEGMPFYMYKTEVQRLDQKKNGVAVFLPQDIGDMFIQGPGWDVLEKTIDDMDIFRGKRGDQIVFVPQLSLSSLSFAMLYAAANDEQKACLAIYVRAELRRLFHDQLEGGASYRYQPFSLTSASREDIQYMLTLCEKENLNINRYWDYLIGVHLADSGLYERVTNIFMSYAINLLETLTPEFFSDAYPMDAGFAQALYDEAHRRRILLEHNKSNFALIAHELRNEITFLIDQQGSLGLALAEANILTESRRKINAQWHQWLEDIRKQINMNFITDTGSLEECLAAEDIEANITYTKSFMRQVAKHKRIPAIAAIYDETQKAATAFYAQLRAIPETMAMNDVNALLNNYKTYFLRGRYRDMTTIQINDIPLLIDKRMPTDSLSLLAFVSNCIENAEGKGGRDIKIVVDSRQYENGEAAISVSNNGPRIEREELEKMFVVGYTARPGGRGIGLAATFQWVKNMGGNIVLESGQWRMTFDDKLEKRIFERADNFVEGARFTVILPTVASNQQNSAHVPEPRAQKPRSSNQFENIDLSLSGAALGGDVTISTENTIETTASNTNASANTIEMRMVEARQKVYLGDEIIEHEDKFREIVKESVGSNHTIVVLASNPVQKEMLRQWQLYARTLKVAFVLKTIAEAGFNAQELIATMAILNAKNEDDKPLQGVSLPELMEQMSREGIETGI